MREQAYDPVCTGCGAVYAVEEPHFRCTVCGEALELPLVQDGAITPGNTLTQTVFDRYEKFYPFLKKGNVRSLKPGFTQLVPMPALAAASGAGMVYIKNETTNPTWSFKDRGSDCGIRRAVQLGFRKVGTVSSGNMGLSIAAFGAHAGLQTYILIGEATEEEKLSPIAIYNPNLIKVSGDYDDLYQSSMRLGLERGIYFINSDEPFRIEGYKTLAFELCEQFAFDPPEFVIVPSSAGGHIRGILKGFLEMRASGLIPRIPTIVCAQGSGCAPIAHAFRENLPKIERVPNPELIDHAIMNPFPPSGNAALKGLRDHGGICVTMTDQELLEAQLEICSSGLFVQPGSAASYAALKRLREMGLLKGSERAVCVVTSTGLKYMSVLQHHKLHVQKTDIGNLAALLEELHTNG